MNVAPILAHRRPAIARLLFLAVLALAAASIIACGGGEPSGPAPSPLSASAEREVRDDAPLVSSIIEVNFDARIELAKSNVPLASNFELTIKRLGPDGDLKDRKILVQSAEITDDSSRVVRLRVDALVPDGSILKVQKSAFRAGETGTYEVAVDSEFDAIGALLASEALDLTDGDVLTSSAVPPVTEADRDPVAMRAALEKHLDARQVPAEVRTAALANFESIPVSIVASPKARAALAALTGTFAEGALSSLLTAANCTNRPAARVAFEPPPDAPDLFARVTYATNGARIVSLNPTIEGERLEHLMPILAHEAIHCDRVSGRFEEIAATAFDSLLYIELIGAVPEIVRAKTPLSREFNVDAIALINSGRDVPESIGVLKSPGVSRTLPGTSDRSPSFADLVAAAYPTIDSNESPDEDLAVEYATVLAERAGIQVFSPFNLFYLDGLLARSVSGPAFGGAIDALGLAPGARAP